MSEVNTARASVAARVWTLLPILAFAQTQTTGRIAGTVRDGQGAVIVNAAINVENSATGEKRATASDTSGNYALDFLPPRRLRIDRLLPGIRDRAFQ